MSQILQTELFSKMAEPLQIMLTTFAIHSNIHLVFCLSLSIMDDGQLFNATKLKYDTITDHDTWCLNSIYNQMNIKYSICAKKISLSFSLTHNHPPNKHTYCHLNLKLYPSLWQKQSFENVNYETSLLILNVIAAH